MARCEDYPCCGHTSGDPCPERHPTTGRIIPRCCTCGKRLSSKARSSICAKCMSAYIRHVDEYGYGPGEDY
jgi:hypothetical protein